MKCPVCNKNSIPFLKIWLRGGFGKYTCEHCDSTLKVKDNPLLAGISIILGLGVAVIGLYSGIWSIFVIVLIIALAIDAVMDINLRQLIETQKDSPNSDK